MNDMRVVDLFSGCGGLSLGFEKAGFDVVAAFDAWDAAIECYRLNFNHPAINLDLSDPAVAVPVIAEFRPDMIIGGPPCQDFSHAGKRIEKDRTGLTGSFAEIVSAIRPRAFLMENVGRARSSMAYASAREIFKASGYGLTEVVLDASLCGVPQKRKRFFCFGLLGGKDKAAENALLADLAAEPMTLRRYSGDSLSFEYYYRHPRNYDRRGIFSIDEPAPTMRGINRPVPKGYPGHPNDPCPVSSDLHVLSTAERAMVQTFPESFIFKGRKTDIEQMIGNAVPVKLAEYVGAHLKPLL